MYVYVYVYVYVYMYVYVIYYLNDGIKFMNIGQDI